MVSKFEIITKFSDNGLRDLILDGFKIDTNPYEPNNIFVYDILEKELRYRGRCVDEATNIEITNKLVDRLNLILNNIFAQIWKSNTTIEQKEITLPDETITIEDVENDDNGTEVRIGNLELI